MHLYIMESTDTGMESKLSIKGQVKDERIPIVLSNQKETLIMLLIAWAHYTIKSGHVYSMH
jgi:hypothetical protein